MLRKLQSLIRETTFYEDLVQRQRVKARMTSLSIYGKDGDPSFAVRFVTNNTGYNGGEYILGLL